MNFSSASVIEQTCWSLRLAEYGRSLNRSKIDDLFNGVPPYTDAQVRENRLDVNVNFLETTKLGHDARRQFYNAFLKPGHFFTITLDGGPIWKRGERGHILTREINRPLKRSLSYYESSRSTFANVVLHGIGPKTWSDTEIAIPKAIGVDDILFPSQTLVSLENVEFFAVYRRYTAAQLHRIISGPKVDPAWNVPMVKRCIEWAQKQGMENLANQDIYSPERMSELLKSDTGFYATDKVPTVDCWDFYNREDSGGVEGWCRRIVLDAQANLTYGGFGGAVADGKVPTRNLIGQKSGSESEFLYDSKKRKVASSLQQIVSFQFGDLSAVAPFRYHSVRGLGFLVFAAGHLLNRLRCRYFEAQFEHMLQYFRIMSPDDVERAEKINLLNRGIIDNSVEFVKAQDRWQVNQPLVEGGLAHLREVIGSNASAYTQDFDFGKERTEKTATQVMAEVNSASALVSAALQQAYSYAVWEYREMCARFCKKNSRDPVVRKFRAAVLKAGIPEEYLDAERWEVEPVRVLGAGNKTLEMAIAEQLMAVRNLLDPEAQRDVLRDYVLANTDDPARTAQLVPEAPRVSNARHDAQLAMASLMEGMPVDIKSGINRIDYIEGMMGSLLVKVQQVEQLRGGVATPEELVGFKNVLGHLQQNLMLLAQDENERQRVRQYESDLTNLANVVRGYEQRLAEMQQQQAEQNGQVDPSKLIELQLEQERGQLKLEQMRSSHAARTAERQTAFELQQSRDQEKHQAELRREAERAVVEDAQRDLEHQAKVKATQDKGQKDEKPQATVSGK